MFGRDRTQADLEPGSTLAVLRPGQQATISEIHDDVARAQALRFGMGCGACVHCISVVPGGPLVLRSGRQEIAVGRGLARRIVVQARNGARDECA
ncbi:MAG: FeoA family protein [Coriobacteriia bacterium]